jgi:hypothetical protein
MAPSHFRKHAENAFGFLVERFGFTSTYVVDEDKSSPTRSIEKVRYTSRDVVVDVAYSGRDEVDVFIDENPPSYCFQLSLFLHAFHPEVWKTLGEAIATSDEELRRELNRLSDVLQRYGKPLLNHDPNVFEKMKTVKWWELPA